ncbi:hypothetical protein EMPS_01144 [Entomortierella parvispora]|uniref:Uncharacterized protein n=1 Tax=Entomortierella parvispora TaxID=205924 RepID=A0A9P3LSA9_9FUNG|nr:hypothetical protein EMPS_01144 [Entomortierella parvispora]
MGGFCMLAMLLELFQLRARPRPLGMDSDEYFANTTVVPHTRHNQVGVSSGHTYKSPVVASKSPRVQKEEYSQPEMTSYPAHGSQYQSPYLAQQQPYSTQQQPYSTQQQPYSTQQQPYPTQQQPYSTQQQPYPAQQQPLPAQQQPLPQQQQLQYYQPQDQNYQPQGQTFQQAYTPQVYTPPPPLQPVIQTTETTTHAVENLPAEGTGVVSTDYH